MGAQGEKNAEGAVYTLDLVHTHPVGRDEHHQALVIPGDYKARVGKRLVRELPPVAIVGTETMSQKRQQISSGQGAQPLRASSGPHHSEARGLS